MSDFFNRKEGAKVEHCPSYTDEERLDEQHVGYVPKQPLIFVLKHRELSSFRAVINSKHHHDIDVNVRDSDGNTALHYAAELGIKKVVRDLMRVYEDTIDTSIVNNAGETALDMATKLGHEDVVDFLNGK